MFGPLTPPLPRRLPFLRLPLAPRKSLAGFMAASVTGACAAVVFWGWIAPLRHNGADLSWTWQDGVRRTTSLLSWLGMENSTVGFARGWLGLGAIGIVAGLVSGVAEALGNFPSSISILR
jgi:diacylglycerol kinase (CTP)